MRNTTIGNKWEFVSGEIGRNKHIFYSFPSSSSSIVAVVLFRSHVRFLDMIMFSFFHSFFFSLWLLDKWHANIDWSVNGIRTCLLVVCVCVSNEGRGNVLWLIRSPAQISMTNATDDTHTSHLDVRPRAAIKTSLLFFSFSSSSR